MNATVVPKKVPVKKKPVQRPAAQRATKKKPAASVYSKKELKDLSANLKESINPSYLSEKDGYSGEKVIEFEVWRLIDCANRIFGFNGWSHSVSEQILDFISEHDGLFDSGVCSLVKVQLKDGTFHEEVGYGHVENVKTRAEAMEKARKLSSDDGLVQAFRHFGNALGNILHEPNYAAAASTFIKDTRKFTSRPKSTSNDASVANGPRESSYLETPSTSSRAQWVPVPDMNTSVEMANIPVPPKTVLYKETCTQTNGPISGAASSTKSKATCDPRTSSTREVSLQASTMHVNNSKVNDLESSPVAPKKTRMMDVQGLNPIVSPIVKNATPNCTLATIVLNSSALENTKANTAPISKEFSPSKLPVNLNTSGSNDSGKPSYPSVPHSPSMSSPSRISVSSASSSPLSAQVNEISFQSEQQRSLQDEERFRRKQRAKAQQEEAQRKYKERLQTQDVTLDVNSIKVEPGLSSPTPSRNVQPRLATAQSYLQNQDDSVLLDVNSIKVEPGVSSPGFSRNTPGYISDKRSPYLQFK